MGEYQVCVESFRAVFVDVVWHVCMFCVQNKGFRGVTGGSLGEHSRYSRVLTSRL